MKKVNYLIIILLTFLFGTSMVFAKNNPYPQYENSPYGGKMINCTWYAWKLAKERAGVELPTWYNVWTWADQARKAGYNVSMTPAPNTIMVLDYNKAFGGTGLGGHAAYVTKVEGNNVTYEEGGNAFIGEGGVATQTDNVQMLEAMGLVGFIYLDKVPTPAPTQTTTKKVTTKKTTTTTTTTTTETTTTTTETTTTTTTSTTTTTKKVEEVKESQKDDAKYYIIAGCAIISIIIMIVATALIKNKKKA